MCSDLLANAQNSFNRICFPNTLENFSSEQLSLTLKFVSLQEFYVDAFEELRVAMVRSLTERLLDEK